MLGMTLRELEDKNLQNVGFEEVIPGYFRLSAELTCDGCAAYQAADSDPLDQQHKAVALTVRLYNTVGWRADDSGKIYCPDCAAHENRR